jgi:GNAT superfamily N-acetyltransferase
MIRTLSEADSQNILEVVNNAARVYKGKIPSDCWKEPYMSKKELKEEIEFGVQFYGWMENVVLVAVMGIQHMDDVTLIRHAYVSTNLQQKGFGEKLLKHLLNLAQTSIVYVGTWQAASWAIKFYQKNGFELLKNKKKNKLLNTYWNIPKRQVETSVVLKLKRQS